MIKSIFVKYKHKNFNKVLTYKKEYTPDNQTLAKQQVNAIKKGYWRNSALIIIDYEIKKETP